MILNMQEGKTVAMMALEGGTHRDGYICLLLIAAVGVDLEGVDLHHKSNVSFLYEPVILIPFFPFDSISFFPESRAPNMVAQFFAFV